MLLINKVLFETYLSVFEWAKHMTELSNYHTPQDLLRALFSPDRKPTKEEMFEQRVSFVYGSMDSDSSITRAQIRAVLAKD